LSQTVVMLPLKKIEADVQLEPVAVVVFVVGLTCGRNRIVAMIAMAAKVAITVPERSSFR